MPMRVALNTAETSVPCSSLGNRKNILSEGPTSHAKILTVLGHKLQKLMKSPQARRQRPGFHQRCHQSQLQSNSVPPTHRKRPPHAWALPAVLTIHLVAGINYWMLSREIPSKDSLLPSLMLLGPSQHHGLFPFLVLWGRPCALFRSRGRPCLCRRLPLPSARGTSLDSSGPSADASVLGA